MRTILDDLEPKTADWPAPTASASRTCKYVTAPAEIPGGERPMLGFETLTLAPIDRRLVQVDILTAEERDQLNAYHARVLAEIGPLVEGDVRAWLEGACGGCD